MIYDEENAIEDLLSLFQTKLNNEIVLINTEKNAVLGDPRFIASLPSDKYIFETLDSGILNYSGFFVRYGFVDTPPSQVSEVNFIEDTTMYFEVCTFDNGEKTRANTFYKLLRYRKAMRETLRKNPDVFRSYAKPLIASLKPTAFPYSNKSIILSIGLDIRASMTAN